jgi:hypothetical protein
MPKDLGQIAPTAPENKKIAAVWIAAETLLNLQSQPLHATAHIRVTGRDPNAPAGWDRDQERSAFNVAVINADGALIPMRISASFICTTMTPGSAPFCVGDGGGREGRPASGSSTITRANPESLAAFRASRRHL